jgi:3',5'-cyclic AMP phosphodiesterase CpdA
MQFVSEPPTVVKIQKMKQRVRWQDPLIRERQIDQTQFVLDDGAAFTEDSDFSFMVIGDSGAGAHLSQNPQSQVAEIMAEHRDECRFVLHTGDVVYLVGSKEFYPSNFIEPYHKFLVGGDNPAQIRYDRMVFSLPILPVPGNHDYYELPIVYGILSQISLPIRRLLRSKIDFDVGLHGSGKGDAYARAFLDYLGGIANRQELIRHLDQHYTAQSGTGRCLRYQPKEFTRLPNRYYAFRYGGIDFFALDSNTFNAPLPLSADAEGDMRRYQLIQKRLEVEQQQQEAIEISTRLNPNDPIEEEQLDDLRTKIEHLEEMERDINKQLAADESPDVDYEQLEWLQHRLIESWHTDSVRGRIVYFHHPPYVTEATKWEQSQTLAVRYRIRQVFDRVAEAVGKKAQNRPLVDLVLNGHAHCLEYLRTTATGHADANIDWIVCGGSGYSLRRQRPEGTDLTETFEQADHETTRLVARSHLFVGRSGHGSHKRRPYSFIRIDVKAGDPLKLVVRPYVAERYQRMWSNQALPAIELGG